MIEKEFLATSLPHGLKFAFKRLDGDIDIYQMQTYDVCENDIMFTDNSWKSDMMFLLMPDGCSQFLRPVIRHPNSLTEPCVQADYNDGKPFVPIDELCDIWIKYGIEKQGATSTKEQFKRWFHNIEIESFPFYLNQQIIKWHFWPDMSKNEEVIYVTEDFNPYALQIQKQP